MAQWKLWAAAGALACGAALAGCTDSGMSRTRVAVGYNTGWGEPYWGWYGDYYYPGTGIYVYDRYRNRAPWTARQRGYWEARRNGWRGGRRASNWRDFGRR